MTAANPNPKFTLYSDRTVKGNSLILHVLRFVQRREVKYMQNLGRVLGNTNYALSLMLKVKIKCYQNITNSMVHHIIHSYHFISIFDPQWLCPRKSGTVFTWKRCPPKFSGPGTHVRDSTMSPIVITIILHVIFIYGYTPPIPHFSTRIPIACQLYEHAYKLLQRPTHEPSYAPPATRQLIN